VGNVKLFFVRILNLRDTGDAVSHYIDTGYA